MDEMGFMWLGDYVAGRLSRSEVRRLEKWLDEGEGRREEFVRWVEWVRRERGEGMVGKGWKVGMEGVGEMEGRGEWGDWERGWREFGVRLERRRRGRRLRRWMRVAAVVMVLVGVGLWWGLERGKGVEERVEVVEVLPGGVEAVLVLGNGERVALGEGGAGVVMEEGVRVGFEGEEGLQYDEDEGTGEDEGVWHRVEVPAGGEYHFVLGDGTRVWVNSESEVGFRVPFGGDKRELEVKGEVYLEVAREEGRPFVVRTGGVDVEVLGTRFNVEAYGGKRGVVTTVAEGRVRVGNGEGEAVLVKGEQGVARETGEVVKRRVDAGVVCSWVEGVFEFEDMPLEEIGERLGRWYDVGFVFEEEGLRARRFTGVFGRNGNLNHILGVIEGTTNVGFEVREGKVLVRMK